MTLNVDFWFAIIISLLIGLIPAFVLYWKQSPLSRPVKWISFVLRWLGTALLALVLLIPREPGWQEVVKQGQISVFIDNSRSMQVLKASPDAIDSFVATLKTNFSIKTWFFGSALREATLPVTFSDSFTDIGTPLKIASLLKNIHSSTVVFITDGHHNYGLLDYSTIPDSSLLLIVGDSLSQCEIRIGDVVIPTPSSMQPFVINIIVESRNCYTDNFKIVIKGDVSRESSASLSPQGVVEVQVPVDGLPAGIYRATIQIMKNDSIIDRRPISIRVIDRKYKIAVLSDITHPDIGAFRRALEGFKTFETELYRSGEPLSNPLPDALIIIGFPERINDWLQTKVPYLWILNSNALLRISKIDKKIKVQRAHGRREIHGSPAPDFYALPGNISQLKQFAEIMKMLPPLSTTGVISAEYEKIFLWQAIEDYALNQPLVFCTENTRCYAMGSGFWLWRLHTYRFLDSHKPFDEFVYALLQFIINKGKVKLESSMPSYVLYRFQPVIINASVIIPGKGYSTEHPVEYTVRDSAGTIVAKGFMIPAQWNYYVKLENLNPGKYNYELKTVIGGKSLTDFGYFTVVDVAPEDIVSGRNEQFVEEWRSKGTVIPLNQWKQAVSIISKHAHQIKTMEPIAIEWRLLALLATIGIFMLVAEWFIRRYYGIV